MYRIDHTTAVAALPTPAAAGTPGFFTKGDPVGGIPATVVTDDWANAIQEELIAIVLAAGLLPSKSNNGQVLAALRSIFSSAVEAGKVEFFARNTAPTGYLKANGAAVSRSVYGALFTAIGTTFGVGDGSTTFNLPELRGEFLRGWSDGRNVDTGRAFGSAQLDALQEFSGQTGLRRLSEGSSLIGNSGVTGGFQFSAGQRGPSTRILASLSADTLSDDQLSFSAAAAGVRTDTETRARNVALLACIKY